MGINFIQRAKSPGASEAFLIGEDFIGSDNIALILGDNFLWSEFVLKIKKVCKVKQGYVFLHPVNNPTYTM